MSGLHCCFCRNSWQAARALQHVPSFPPFWKQPTTLLPGCCQVLWTQPSQVYSAATLAVRQEATFQSVHSLAPVSPEQLVLAQQFLWHAAQWARHGKHSHLRQYKCSLPRHRKPLQLDQNCLVSVIGLHREPWPAFEVRTTGSLGRTIVVHCRHTNVNTHASSQVLHAPRADIDERLWA